MSVPTWLKLDIKDTARLVVWVVIATFTLGGFWAQRKIDVERLDTAVANEARHRERDVTELKLRVTAIDGAMLKQAEASATIGASLEGIRTELRYLNQKIEILREDARDARRRE